MGDLYMVVNPNGKSESTLRKKMDLMVKLIDQAEIYMQQPVKDVEGIKALIAELKEIGLNHAAKELEKLIENL